VSAVNHPLSPAHRRLWLSTQLRPRDPFYNVAFTVTLHGPLDKQALEKALAAVSDRHPALRLVFRFDGRELTAVEEPTAPQDLTPVQVDGVTAPERRHSIGELAARFAAEPFDLTRGPVLRIRLARVDECEHVLLVCVHHIVFDGASLGIFVRELAALYDTYASGNPHRLSAPVDYGAMIRRDTTTTARRATESLRYWTGELSGAPEVMELPVTGTRSPNTRYEAARRTVCLAPELTDRLRAAGGAHRASLFAVLKAAFDVLLYQHGAPDIVTGLAVSVRDGTELTDAIGYFAKPVLQRVVLTGTERFDDVLRQVRDRTLDAYDHPDLAFDDVLDALGMARDPGYNPLYQVTFGLNERLAGVAAGGVRFEVAFIPLPTCKAELELTVSSAEGGLEAELGYRSDLFDAPTIDLMLARYRLILERVAGDPEIPVRELIRPSDQEFHFVVEQCNQTGAEYPADKLIHELFLEQAARTPDAVAVRAGGTSTTYRELREAADVVCGQLREAGVCPEVAVGVLLPRSVRLIATMLGIFQAGGVYVPLDGTLPDRRLRDLAEDAGLAVVVTEGGRAESVLTGLPVRILSGEASGSPGTAVPAIRPSGKPATSADAAYILYTSGSTGRPKGVVLEHRNLINLITWAHRECGTEMFQVVPFISSVGFDVAMWEVFTALGCGGTVVVAEDAFSLARTPGAEDATVLTAVPSVLTEILKGSGLPPRARTVFSNGELLAPALLEALYSQPTVDVVYNMCAPTETTTFSLFNVVHPGGPIPLGRPMANTTAYVLDQWLRPVPPGVGGQLYLGGAGITRGYLNRPDLTATRFVADPFAAAPGRRLYSTGDLARQLPDGRIVFLGRADHQVKLRGVRIELGEVEVALLSHPDVTDACVTVVRSVGNGQLVAAVATRAGSTVTAPALSALLRERLPEFMVPARIEARAALPLLPSGKLDRAQIGRELEKHLRDAAEAPQPGGIASADPGTTEHTIAALWGDLLGHAAGPDQNFFDAGGNSLLLLRMREALRELGHEVSAPELMRRPTVRGIAGLLSPAGEAPVEPGRSRAESQRRAAAQISRARRRKS
jgi:amino acid adenylation domain-containing protein